MVIGGNKSLRNLSLSPEVHHKLKTLGTSKEVLKGASQKLTTKFVQVPTRDDGHGEDLLLYCSNALCFAVRNKKNWFSLRSLRVFTRSFHCYTFCLSLQEKRPLHIMEESENI